MSPEKPTDEDIRIDMSVCAHDLAPAPAADAEVVVAESTPPNHLYRNILTSASRQRVERIGPAKPPTVSSKYGCAALCIGRESGDGFVHNGLSVNSHYAWARRSRRAQLVAAVETGR